MATLSELRILFRVVDAATSEMSRISGGLDKITAAQLRQNAAAAKNLSSQQKTIQNQLAAVDAKLKEIPANRAILKQQDDIIRRELGLNTQRKHIIQDRLNKAKSASAIERASIALEQNAVTRLNIEKRRAQGYQRRRISVDTENQLLAKQSQLKQKLAEVDAALGKSTQSISKAQQAMNMLSGATGAAVNALGRLASVGAIGLGVLTAAVTAIGIGFDAFRQKTEFAFGGLLKDMGAGKAFTEEIFNWTRKTALGFQQTVDAATELRARGFGLREIIPTLQAIGDQAAALPRPIDESMQRISYALGQIRQSATLWSQDMRQLTEAGVDAWRYLADFLQVSVGEARVMAREGVITGRDASQAIIDGMQKNFSGLLALQRTTFTGMVSVAKRTFSELTGVFAQPLFERLNKGMLDVDKQMSSTRLRETIREWGLAFDGFIGSFARGINAVIIPAIKWIANNKGALASIFVAAAASFALIHPVIALFAAGGVLLAGIGLMKARVDQLPPSLLKVKKEILDFAIGVENVKRNIERWATDLADMTAKAYDIIINAKFQGISVKEIWDQLIQISSKTWDLVINVKIGGETIGSLFQGVNNWWQDFSRDANEKLRDMLGGFATEITTRPTVVPWDKMTEMERERIRIQGALELAKAPPTEESTEGARRAIEDAYSRTQAFAQAAAGVGDAAEDAKDKLSGLGNAIGQLISAAFAQPTREEASLALRISEAKRMQAQESQSQEAYRELVEGDIARMERQIESIRKTGGKARSRAEKMEMGREAQIEAMERRIAEARKKLAQPSATDRLVESLQKQSELMQLDNEIQKGRLQLADQTLLTEQQQAQLVAELNTQISNLTSGMRDSGIIPAFVEVKDALKGFAEVLRGFSKSGAPLNIPIPNIEGIRHQGDSFIPKTGLYMLQRGEGIVSRRNNMQGANNSRSFNNWGQYIVQVNPSGRQNLDDLFLRI